MHLFRSRIKPRKRLCYIKLIGRMSLLRANRGINVAEKGMDATGRPSLALPRLKSGELTPASTNTMQLRFQLGLLLSIRLKILHLR